MDDEYDVFETVNGEPMWRCSVIGTEAAIDRLEELATASKSKVCIVRKPTCA
jgi:hypothetical protein